MQCKVKIEKYLKLYFFIIFTYFQEMGPKGSPLGMKIILKNLLVRIGSH